MLYFLVRGIMGFLRAGYAYLLSAWRLLGVCKLALAASVCGLHLSRCAMAKQQWAAFLKHPRDAFTDFYPLARQSQIYIVMSALLLFVLVLKVICKGEGKKVEGDWTNQQSVTFERASQICCCQLNQPEAPCWQR